MIKRKSRTLRRQFKQAVQHVQPQLFKDYEGFSSVIRFILIVVFKGYQMMIAAAAARAMSNLQEGTGFSISSMFCLKTRRLWSCSLSSLISGETVLPISAKCNLS